MSVVVSEDSSESISVTVENDGEGSYLRITNLNDDSYVNLPNKIELTQITDEMHEVEFTNL